MRTAASAQLVMKHQTATWSAWLTQGLPAGIAVRRAIDEHRSTLNVDSGVNLYVAVKGQRFATTTTTTSTSTSCVRGERAQRAVPAFTDTSAPGGTARRLSGACTRTGRCCTPPPACR